MSKHLATITLFYEDCSTTTFDCIVADDETAARATFMMVTRGTLYSSSAKFAEAYDSKGRTICSYRKDKDE